MRLLSLLSLCCIATAVIAQVNYRRQRGSTNAPSQSGNRGGQGKGLRRINPNNMTEGEAAEYKRKFGFNPKRQLARMQRLKSMRSRDRTEKPMSAETQARRARRKEKYGNLKTSRPSNDSLDLMEVNQKSGIDEMMLEGDINLTDEQMKRMEEEEDGTQSRNKRQVALTAGKWPGNTIYYTFDSSIGTTTQSNIVQTLAYLQARTCLNFVQSSTAPNRIRVISGDGCYSYVGMSGGEQSLSLGVGCTGIGTIAHEFLHAAGLYHEMSRSDRDNYVRVDLSAVPAAYQSNFNKLSSNVAANYAPFEYGSVMMYSATSFVTQTNAISVDPLDDDFLFTMGTRQVSVYDLQNINIRYGCSCPSGSVTCVNGGTPNPRGCSSCICPLGYGGKTCSEKPAGCGSNLTATTNWQTTTITVGTSTSQVTRNDYSYCTSWVNAPAGTQIQVRISGVYNGQCQYGRFLPTIVSNKDLISGCPFNGIELKIKSDRRLVSPRFCCAASSDIYTSQLNPTPLIAFNRYYYSQFQVDYRYVSAGSVPSPAPSPTPSPSTSCVDSTDSCIPWTYNGFCQSTSYDTATKKKYCAKSCGLC